MMLITAFIGDLIKPGDYIGYQPDYRECILLEEETGWDKKQTLKTEEFKYQFAGIIHGQVILVADGATEPIFLKGMTGHKKGPDAMQRYVQECYSSKVFGAKGICLTGAIFEKLEKIPEKLINKDYKYFLSTPYICPFSHSTYFGVRYVDKDYFTFRILCDAEGENHCYNFGVRPTIILPSDIKIDENKNLIPYKD